MFTIQVVGKDSKPTLRDIFGGPIIFIYLQSDRKVTCICIQVVGKDRKPSLKDREQMPYVEATLCEVQRLGNIGSFLFFNLLYRQYNETDNINSFK